MEDEMTCDLPDWRTTQQSVILFYKDDGNDSDEAERYYPLIRRPKDAEPKLSWDQEFRLMEEQVEESQGFDIDFTKFRCLFNYQPVPFELEYEFMPDETTTDFVDRLSREALHGFNEKNSTKYDFVKVIKANCHDLMGILFYITFEGKLHTDYNSKEFQAKVWYSCSGCEVISCDLKPNKKKVHSIEALEKEDPKKPRMSSSQSDTRAI